jgi:hypothetical protein
MVRVTGRIAAVRGFSGIATGWVSVCLFGASGIQPPGNAAPGVGYVGSKVCAASHRKIYDEYIRTPMGRSLAALPATPESATPAPSLRIAGARSNRFYEVERREDGLYQSEIVVDAQGPRQFIAVVECFLETSVACYFAEKCSSQRPSRCPPIAHVARPIVVGGRRG